MPEWKHEIRRRLANLNLAPTRETTIVEELAQHLDECYAEWLASGTPEAEAERRTWVELSESELLLRELRRVGRQIAPEPIILGTNLRSNMIMDLWQDVRFGLRQWWKQPSFTLLVVVTLGLGIGINTAVYSVVDAVLFRPLPFAAPEQLVEIWQNDPDRPYAYRGLRWDSFQEWRQQKDVFVQVEAFSQGTYTLTGGKKPETVAAPGVSAGLFAMLGVAPQLGRHFQPNDAEVGNSRAVLISHEFWQNNFGAARTRLAKR